jgi:hypothetical protein
MPVSGENDFDFLRGRWCVRHRRLAKRLANSDDWEEFDGVMLSQPILGGQGNIDDNVLNYPGGTFRAAAVRAFDVESGTWSIWWLDARYPTTLGTPLIGGFASGVGEFYADEIFDGRPVRTRFLWTNVETPTPRWQQAFSIDGGATWETNWIMDFRRE